MYSNNRHSLAVQINRLTAQGKRLDDLISCLMPLLCERQEADSQGYPSDPMRLKDAAILLGVHQTVIHRLLKQGNLRFWKLPGGYKRVSRAEVLALPVPGSVDEKQPPVSTGQPILPIPKRERNKIKRFTKLTLG